MRATQIDTIELPQSGSTLEAGDPVQSCLVHGLDAAYAALLREILELEAAGLVTISPDNDGELRVRLTALGNRSSG